MPPDSSSRRRTSPDAVRDSERSEADPRVLLFMESGRDRELLVEALGDTYRVETTTDVETIEETFDCVIFDAAQFNRVAGTIQPRRAMSNPVFFPFVLLIGEGSVDETAVDVWKYVDDVVRLPVEKAALLSRIGNLIERRQTALRLAEREAQLERTVEDLQLKERAMDAAPIGITITEAGPDDNPIVYANEEFEALTGYSSDIIGEDCRFLQGEETDPDTRTEIREAIRDGSGVSVDVLNYRKDGRKFWNKLDIAPIRDADDEVVNFVGFQTDITDRKIRARRLEVLNRLLSHNLRNKMNLIQGHADLLEDELDGQEVPRPLAAIDGAASDLLELAETVRKIERITGPTGTAPVIDLGDRLSQLLSAFEDRYPEATFEITILGSGPYEVAVAGLTTAIEEAIENALEHNDRPEPSVEVRVRRRSDGWIDVEVEDDGPGIPEQEIAVLRDGETPLRHGNRLGIWLMYWVVNKAGGSFSVSEATPRGTIVTLSVPAATDDS